MFGSIGGEVSLTYNQLSGGHALDPEGNASLDLIGFRHFSGADEVETSSETQFGQFRIMATHDHAPSGTQLLGGFGALSFSSDIKNRRVDIAYFNTVDLKRSADYKGMGLVAGARKAIPIGNNAMLQLEGIAGVYSGHRDLKLDEVQAGGFTTKHNEFSTRTRQTVNFLDLAASVELPADRIAPGGVFEFGLAYTRLFNVMDTSTYNDYSHTYAKLNSISLPGSADDDVDALSLFFGLQIPL